MRPEVAWPLVTIAVLAWQASLYVGAIALLGFGFGAAVGMGLALVTGRLIMEHIAALRLAAIEDWS